jgi:hypothetical protein
VFKEAKAKQEDTEADGAGLKETESGLGITRNFRTKRKEFCHTGIEMNEKCLGSGTEPIKSYVAPKEIPFSHLYNVGECGSCGRLYRMRGIIHLPTHNFEAKRT